MPCSNRPGLRTDVKWPNDVQVAGKKLAGILIETSIARDETFVLVGTGINVNFDPRPHEEIRDIATSLSVELGRDVEREALLAAYLARFERMYGPRSPANRCWTPGARASSQSASRCAPRGPVAASKDSPRMSMPTGALIVRTADGARVTVEAGDVTLRQ